jgi:hypothetical protein
MDKPKNIQLNNMEVRFHNLGGRPNDYGDVVLDVSFEVNDDLAAQLKKDGYHVSQWTPKNDPDAEPINLFKGIISFRDKTGQLKPRYQRPEILLVMEGETSGVRMSESMLASNFGNKKRLEILYADEVEVNAANKPRKDGDGYTAYINSMVLVCKKKSKYDVAADDEEEYEED